MKLKYWKTFFFFFLDTEKFVQINQNGSELPYSNFILNLNITQTQINDYKSLCSYAIILRANTIYTAILQCFFFVIIFENTFSEYRRFTDCQVRFHYKNDTRY